jgi:hypothetical protein
VVWAPLTALSILGALARPRWPEGAWPRLALAAAPLALLFVMSGYVNWRGGWFPGPRYLLPVLPLVFVLVARGAESALERPLGRVLVAVGALWGWAMLWPVLAAFPFPPGDFSLPALTLAPRLLADGIVVPSWLPPGVLAALLTALAPVAGGQLLVLATPRAKGLERFVAVAFLAVALLAANAAPRERGWQASLEGAVIHDLYADGPRGELEALRLRADTPARRAAVEALIMRRDAAR